MLRNIGQQLGRFGLAFIVGLLVVVFTFTNPFNNNDGCGSASGPRVAVTVYGEPVTTGDFQAALALAALGFSGGRSTELAEEVAAQYNLRQHVLDGFIERALLARQADALGFAVEQDKVWEKLRADRVALLSLGSDATALRLGREVPFPVNDEDGNFSAEDTKRVIKYGLNRSVGEFAENQVKEQLAERMRQLVSSTVHVSRQEVWNAYVQERDRAVISYIRFRPGHFGDGLEPSEAELKQFVEAEREALEAEYEARKQEFTELERQVRGRHILVRLEQGASEETATEARERADGILKKVQAPGASFATLAQRYSDDTVSARRGGRLATGQPGGEVLEALQQLSPGETSGIVEGPRGLHILRADRVLEGTLDKETALLVLAEERFRKVQGRAAAESAANTVLTAARAGSSFEDALGVAGLTAAGDDDPDPLLGDRPPSPDRPTVERSRRVGRGGIPITGVNNAELMQSIFDELSLDQPLPESVLDTGTEFIVFRLEEREHPVEQDFEEFARDRIEQGLTSQKQQEALIVFVHRLRQRAEDEGAIVINEGILRAPDDA